MNTTERKETKIKPLDEEKDATGPFEVNINGERFPADTAKVYVSAPTPFGPVSTASFRTPEVEFVSRTVSVSLDAEVAPGTHPIKPNSVYASYIYTRKDSHGGGTYIRPYRAEEGFIKLNASDVDNQTMSASFELVFYVEGQRHMIDGHFNLKGQPE